MHYLDARGLRCPLPLLRLKQTLNGLAAGSELHVVTTDPGSVKDFQAFLRQAGHSLVELREEADGFAFVIRKKAAEGGA